ncbi:hypothetical protein H4683_003526 [Filibacter limicola]|uniref:Uncharacterized protein n=1 Tax=Sporosarcina limicola TaxID=34101 RepID=A0A927MLY2_9BACL|nr:hypothetical protein [Sporosarcina limicola]
MEEDEKLKAQNDKCDYLNNLNILKEASGKTPV